MSSSSNFQQKLAAIEASGVVGAKWRALEVVVEGAVTQSLGDRFAVSAQESRDYANGVCTRTDVRVAERRVGGASVVIDAKCYTGTISKKEVEKLARDKSLSRASGGVLVALDASRLSASAATLAAESNIKVVSANRNLASNIGKSVAAVIAASGAGSTAAVVRLNGDGSVDRRSAAVRDGSLLLAADGTVDGRSAAVRRGDVRVAGDGSVSAASRALQAQQKQQRAAVAAVASSGNATSGVSVDRRSADVLSGNVKLTNSNAIDRRSAAVRSGDVFFKSDGSVDRRCSAARSGALRTVASKASAANAKSSSASSAKSSSKSSSKSSGKSSGSSSRAGASRGGGGGKRR